jgi:hypothetical protein
MAVRAMIIHLHLRHVRDFLLRERTLGNRPLPSPRKRKRNRQRGVALVAVMIAMAITLVITNEFGTSSRAPRRASPSW